MQSSSNDVNTKAFTDISEILIRYAEETDLTGMEWEGEYSHYRQLYRDIYFSSLRGDGIIWLAELLDHGIVGQIFAQLRSSRRDYADGSTRAYLFGFRVRFLYQNSGVGSLLLSTAEKELFDRGFHCAVLNVSKTNHHALQYYIKSGYIVEGDDPGIWSYTDQFGKLREVYDPSWRMLKTLKPVHE
jgi:ribosomal protein S18 acetylase RimI-like enzyme